LLIIPVGFSRFLEICSTPPFCFWGTTSSTSLILGLELKLLNELDFNNVPIHRNKKSYYELNEKMKPREIGDIDMFAMEFKADYKEQRK